LIVDEKEIYNLPNDNAGLEFSEDIEAHSDFQKLNPEVDKESAVNDILLVLYHRGEICFKFTKGKDGKFLPQKGFNMPLAVWNDLKNEKRIQVLFHMLQYHFVGDINNVVVNFYHEHKAQVAMIITTNNRNIHVNPKKFKIKLEDIEENTISNGGTSTNNKYSENP